MTAIQFQPQPLSGMVNHHRNRLHAQRANSSIVAKTVSPFPGTLARPAQPQPPRTGATTAPAAPRFAGRFFNRVADDSAIICDTMNLQHAEAPLEVRNKTDQLKLAIAEELSDWMANTLNQRNAIAAVIARNGKEQAQRHDATGMAHSGLALFDQDKKQWIVYNLLNDEVDTSATDRMLDYLTSLKDMGPRQIGANIVNSIKSATCKELGNGLLNFASYFKPQNVAEGLRLFTNKVNMGAQVFRSEPLDFFYEQPIHKRDALIMIPDEDVQKRLRDGILSGRYKKLYFTPKYNLVSEPHSNTSLNCNKWVLMNLLAAQKDDYCHTKILQAIKDGFKPGRIMMNPLLRPIAKIHPTIRSEEVPVYGPINTVTVESLYHSGLFPHKEFFVPRELKPRELSFAGTGETTKPDSRPLAGMAD